MTNPTIKAYFYESRIVDGPGTSRGWSNQLRDSHPDTISNIEYRNLQRLVPADQVDVDADPVAFKYESETLENTTEHVTRADIRDDPRVSHVQPLVPLPEDIGDGPSPEPMRERGLAEYYVSTDEDDTWYYRALIDEDTVERTCEDGETIEDMQMYDLWRLDRENRVTQVQYEETPFADPKY